MGPRPDQQPGGHAPGGERAVLLEGLLDEQILPAAHQQDRDRDPLQRGTALQRSPERVGEAAGAPATSRTRLARGRAGQACPP